MTWTPRRRPAFGLFDPSGAYNGPSWPTETFWNSQLENAVTVPDYAAWLDRHRALSALADQFGQPERIATGCDEAQAVWRLPLGREDVGLIYIHGGYWRRYCANDYAFVAETAAASRATLYNVDYRLMPHARMGELVSDVTEACRVALDACERCVIVGHSAGAHLAVEALLRLPRKPAAVVAVSGLYDLAPLRFAFIQRELAFTTEEVQAYSPLQRADEVDVPLHLYVGADETVEFRRQTARLYDAVRMSGGTATVEFVPERHHVAIVADLANPASRLSGAIQNLLS